MGDTFYSEISGHQVKQTYFKVPQDFVFIYGIKYSFLNKRLGYKPFLRYYLLELSYSASSGRCGCSLISNQTIHQLSLDFDSDVPNL